MDDIQRQRIKNEINTLWREEYSQNTNLGAGNNSDLLRQDLLDIVDKGTTILEVRRSIATYIDNMKPGMMYDLQIDHNFESDRLLRIFESIKLVCDELSNNTEREKNIEGPGAHVIDFPVDRLHK